MGDSYYEYFLAHHGIKGQKWGDRNGPPYPLNPSDHSAAEKKAVSKSSKKSYTEGEDSKGLHLTDSQKKAIKIGAAVVATGLAAYGGYKLYKSGALKKFVKTGAKTIGDGYSSGVAFKMKDNFFTDISEDAKAINPLKHSEYYKPGESVMGKTVNEKFVPYYQLNCQACSLAYEMRRRGFDVCAKGIDTTTIPGWEAASKIFKGGKYSEVGKISSFAELSEKLAKNGEGARGFISIGNVKNSSTHSIAWEILDGRTVFTDGQIEASFDDPAAFTRFYKASLSGIKTIRTDNLELNDLEFISNLVSDTFIH